MSRNSISFVILLSLLLSACQAAAPAPAAPPTWTVVPLPAQAAAASPIPPAAETASVDTASVVSTGDASASDVSTAAASAQDASAGAGATVEPSAAEKHPAAAEARSYFMALEAGDFQAAANLYSSFSLMMAGMTRGEAALELQGKMARGARWSDLAVKETRPFDDRTVLVRVTYLLESNDLSAPGASVPGAAAASTAATGPAAQVEALWPMRLEHGRWLYNRDNLIDYRVLDVPEQAAGGLIVKPLRLTRFSDHIRLALLVQNTTNEAIVLGQANEILAAFLFKDQKVEAVQKQMVFDRLRTSTDAAIEAQGLFETFPDGVIIRQWKTYNVKPWFTFEFSE